MTKSLKPVLILILLCFTLWIFNPVISVMAEPSAESSESTESTTSSESDDKDAESSKKVDKEKNEDGLEVPELTSKSILLTDLNSGKVLYSRNVDKKMEPASLTKIMTVLLAVEAIEEGSASEKDKVVASDDCLDGLDEASSSAGIVPGERLTLIDLMYCAMLASAGEACNIIAEHLSGNIKDFVSLMNDRAAELGCKGTHFVNPHGMPADNHYSTANDIYLLSKEAMSHELFAKICSTPSYEVGSTNKSDERILYNSNALLCSQGIYGGNFLYSYANGIKTGHTTAAGYCLASTAQKDDIRLMCVVMGAGTTLRDDNATDFHNFSETIALYNWVFDNYQNLTVLSAEDLISEVQIKFAPSDESSVTLHPDCNIVALVPKTLTAESFEKTVTLYEEEPSAPIEAGQALGEVSLSLNGTSYGTAKLLASSSVDLSRSQYLKAQFRKAFGHTWLWLLLLIILFFVLLYVFLVLRYRHIRQRQLMRKRQQEQARVAQKTRQAREQMTPRAGKMREYDHNGTPKNPHADKHEYFEEFFRNEEAHNKKRRK